MDFMKLFKSLEELLYEVIVMLVFFPRTLWLTFRYPQRMLDYADTELGDVQSEQYSDTLSPPLFLMLCVGLNYLAQTASAGDDVAVLPGYLADTQNLLAVRVLLFSLLPLLMALRLLGRLQIPLDRETLRAPFYAQCFVAAPLAMMVGFAQAIRHVSWPHSGYVALCLILLSLGWYFRQQAHWFRTKLGVTLVRGWSMALSTGLLTMLILFFTAFLLLTVLE